MRNGEVTAINGAWSEQENAWVSDNLCLTGDCWLEVSLPDKGRIVIRKAEKEEGPWPMALVTSWSGPDFRIRCYGSTLYRYIRIYLTETPKTIQYANIQRRPTSWP